ncbi:MAG: DUF3108 domain-containing protein [bacterium]
MKKHIFLYGLIVFVLSSCATIQNKVSILEVTQGERLVRAEAQKQNEKNSSVDSSMLYKVRKGDSLWKISKAISGKGSLWNKLALSNSLKEDIILKEGIIINISVLCESLDDNEDVKNKSNFVYRVTENKAFGVGEKLTFGVKYFGVTAGIAVLEVKDIEKYNDRQVYHIDATARTAPFFEPFYRVKDVISTYMDVMGLFSWKYSKKLEEGGYRNTTIMDFNHEQSFAVKNNGDKCDIVPFVQDVLSEFYYFRSVYKGENEIKIDVSSDECKTYQIVVKKLRNEKVTTDAGEFDCIVVQPFLKYEGIFRQKGDIWIWLTNDKNLMPVIIKSQIAIGTIDVILQSADVVKAE